MVKNESSEFQTAEEVLNVVWDVVEFSGFEEMPQVHSVGILGNTPLKVVITWGDLNAVRLLLEAGSDIQARLEHGFTPLHYAISLGEFAIAKYLIQQGADYEVRNDEGQLPCDLCWESEWEELLGS